MTTCADPTVTLVKVSRISAFHGTIKCLGSWDGELGDGLRFIKEASLQKLLGIALLMLWTAAGLRAQENCPILSGGVQFLSSTVGGNTFFQPAIAPVLVVPLGEHWLVESRADLRGFIAHQDGSTGPYQGQFIASLEYLQLDYIANPHVTVTVGRFLTPFNIYDKRFTPFWIRDLNYTAYFSVLSTT